MVIPLFRTALFHHGQQGRVKSLRAICYKIAEEKPDPGEGLDQLLEVKHEVIKHAPSNEVNSLEYGLCQATSLGHFNSKQPRI